MSPQPYRKDIITAGTLLGMGLGGFIDGILLHQLLQWHNVMSNRVAPIDLVAMKYNMVWDGIFHLLVWTLTALGLALLWRAVSGRAGSREVGSTRTFVGSLALGWGLFNVVEGLIDHHLLHLHHVRPGAGQLAWDIGFLVFGALLIVVGWGSTRARRRDRRDDTGQDVSGTTWVGGRSTQGSHG